MSEVPVINIDKIEGRLLRRYDGKGFGVFGVTLSKLKYISTTDIPTAATDGKNLYYNPYFMSKLSIEQQCFILGHEILHVAFNHLKRSKDRNQDLWNIATDAVINAVLVDDGFVSVEGAVNMQEGRKMSADDIYEMLVKQNEEQKNSQGESRGNYGESENNNEQQKKNQSKQEEIQNKQRNSQAVQDQQKSNDMKSQDDQVEKEQQNRGHAPHDLWKRVFEKEEKNQEDSQSKQGKNENLDEGKSESDSYNQINENEIIKKMRESANREREERRKQRMQTTIEGPKSKTVFMDLGYQKPIVPWQSILRAAARGEQDFSYANATVEYGVLRPHLKTIPRPETQIVLDTSGSVSETLLKNFLRECKNIFSRSKITAGCFDTKFYGFHEIKCLKDIDNFKIEGRGDTDFNKAVSAFSPRVENHIIFTDGEATMPKKMDRAIWVVFGDENSEPRKIKPKGAIKVIYISREEYKKLCRQNFKEEEYER